MKNTRRASKFIFLLIANMGIVGFTFRKFVLPFVFSSSFPYSSFSDPLNVIQNTIAMREFPLFALGSLLIIYAIVGKFFCGWACPFGTFQDILARMRFEPPEMVHKVFLSFKYIAFLAMVALAFFSRKPLFSTVAPHEALFASLPNMIKNGIYIDAPAIARYLVFFGLIFAFIFIPRFYCRYLCPVSALASPVSKYSLLTLAVSDECDGCEKCARVCGMNIVPYKNPRSAECDKCGGCVDACPKNALRLGFGVSSMQKEDLEEPELKEKKFFTEIDRKHIPKADGPLEYVPLPLYEKSSEDVQSVLGEALFEALTKTRPKLRYFHSGKVPEIFTLMEKYTQTKPEIIDVRNRESLSSHLGIRRPTLFINGKIYPYSLAEEDLAFYLKEERKMFEKLSLIVDTSRCLKCLTKKCQECEVFIIDTNHAHDVSNVADMGCNLCGMCMTVCPYDAITLSYSDSKTYHYTSLQHLKHNRGRLNEIDSTFAEIFVKKDSPFTDKLLTMIAALSYMCLGKISFLVTDAEENPLKARQKDISVLPTILFERERSLGPPSEASLILLVLRNDRKKRGKR